MSSKHFHFDVDFKVPSHGLSTGAIAGIVVGICVFIVLILLALWKMGFLCGKEETDQGKIKSSKEVGALMTWFLLILGSDWFEVNHDS